MRDRITVNSMLAQVNKITGSNVAAIYEPSERGHLAFTGRRDEGEREWDIRLERLSRKACARRSIGIEIIFNSRPEAIRRRRIGPIPTIDCPSRTFRLLSKRFVCNVQAF
jgi:hypothetical protein